MGQGLEPSLHPPVMVATRGGGCCSPQDSPPHFPTRGTYQRALPTALGPCPATWDTLASGAPVPAVPCRPAGCGEGTGTESKPPTLLPQDFPRALLQPGSHRPGSESLNRCRPRFPSVKWGNTSRATTGSGRAAVLPPGHSGALLAPLRPAGWPRRFPRGARRGSLWPFAGVLAAS